MVVVLGSFEGQVKGEAGSEVASFPAGRFIDTSLADIDQPLIDVGESDHWHQNQYEENEGSNTHPELKVRKFKVEPQIRSIHALMYIYIPNEENTDGKLLLAIIN